MKELSSEFIAGNLEVSQRWAKTPYYDAVEKAAQAQWDKLIYPRIADLPINWNYALELSIGHGRMTQILLEKSLSLVGVDLLEENIKFCRERFSEVPGYKFRLYLNNGVDLKEVIDNTITFVFCWDSMIHFDSDVVRSYLHEFYRVMKPESYAFLHHSNLMNNPGGDFQKNAHARNFMSKQLFAHYAYKAGFEVVKQDVINWGMGPKMVKSLDCISILKKP